MFSSAAAAKHTRPVELFGEQRLGAFRTKIAKEYEQGVASVRLQFLERLHGIVFIFDGRLHFGDLSASFAIGLHNGGPAALGKIDGEAIAADGDDAELTSGIFITKIRLLL
jgi:hypothetical protein